MTTIQNFEVLHIHYFCLVKKLTHVMSSRFSFQTLSNYGTRPRKLVPHKTSHKENKTAGAFYSCFHHVLISSVLTTKWQLSVQIYSFHKILRTCCAYKLVHTEQAYQCGAVWTIQLFSAQDLTWTNRNITQYTALLAGAMATIPGSTSQGNVWNFFKVIF